ncbi:conserved exported protein of unknown function (plasmid) [Ralstonia solanacearum PSI07]|uniref:Uncharacterized protein n=1 Tax=blood disease bacterium R229 TaxID=741978 RepID=G2ZSU1_9RALS|nr:conserved exported protein of unknown function [Ralstonia solanacearum PSI07]CCA82104.1 conserved exported hypothetical protein [blood disease bacterium R229]
MMFLRLRFRPALVAGPLVWKAGGSGGTSAAAFYGYNGITPPAPATPPRTRRRPG